MRNHRFLWSAIFTALAVLIPFAAGSQPFGINTRDPNTSILISNLPADPGTMMTEEPFPALTFTSPIHVTNAGDGTNRVFIVQQGGIIRSFDSDLGSPTVTNFLNITTRVLSGGERGLLSVAFHPNYASNGRFFVYYTSQANAAAPVRAGGDIVVSEFINSNPSGNPPATPTERILYVIGHSTFSNHNGGQLQFGADGYLYAGHGDGGSGDDPFDAGQTMSLGLGKILRIDVDATPDAGKEYHVPADNPLLYALGGTSNTYVTSRQPGGALSTPAQGYEEFGTDFTDSALESTASGLTATRGSRASTNTPLVAIARFTPTIPTEGLYNVYVTTPANALANAANTTYRIVTPFGDLTYRVALTNANTGNQWRRVRRNVHLPAGTGSYFQISETATQSGSMFSDAVRFERVTGVLPEIWAYGVRNPWRFSPDRLTGAMWLGDVGQNNREEIDVLEAGANCGWRDVEGNICNPAFTSNCDLTGYHNPIAVYAHGGAPPTGCSITGGYVYRGTAVPSLYGTYIYAEYCSGWIRGLKWDGTSINYHDYLVASTGLNITSFGEMEDGDVVFVASDGRLRRLRPSVAPPPSDLPLHLSDMPPLLTVGMGGQVTGVIPFEPRVPFWTDGALKTRYLALPGVAQTTYQAAGGWDMPNGTTLIKNYNLPLIDGNPGSAVRVETRLLIKDGTGTWRGFSYKWNDAQTDASLLTEASTRDFTITTVGGPLSYTWQFPSSDQCLRCHTSNANNTLSLQTVQMNTDYLFPGSGVTDNQLRTYDHINLFTAPGLPGAPSTLPSMPSTSDVGATLTERAKAYLQANCAHCHLPGGPTGTLWDGRYGTALASMNLVGVTPLAGNLGVAGAEIVKAGFPDESVLLLRMETLDSSVRMPPLTTTREDEVGTALIREWILSLGGASEVEGWMLY